MSATTSAASGSASATSSCQAKLYDIPVHDAACAMPMTSNYSSIMKNCCFSAPIVEYDDCDYYCLAEGQSVGTLAECLIKASEPGEVWCNANANATATATTTATATATSIDSTGAATSNGATATSTNSNSAGTIAPRSISKSTISIVGMLLIGSAAGLFI